jgi:hypothetical protein
MDGDKFGSILICYIIFFSIIALGTCSYEYGGWMGVAAYSLIITLLIFVID